MEDIKLLERRYKTNFDCARNFVNQNNLSAAKEAFKKALEIALKLVEVSASPRDKDKYMESAKEVSGHLNTINKVLGSAASQAKAGDKKEIESKESSISVQETEKISIEEALEKLNELEGLKEVKEKIAELVALLEIDDERKKNGLPVIVMSHHLIFTGNAGTGKTTVARLIAQIYHSLGIISKGHLVETSTVDLVAGYVGQTPAKTQKVIDSAIGGVLFIDEAYTLKNDSNTFGQEAIDTLLKAMEDKRDDFVVIVAGYADKMEKFINSNSGLLSRFKNTIDFTDYTGAEMLNIFRGICKKNKYVLGEGVEEYLAAYFDAIYKIRDRSTGNARFVRNTFEGVISAQSVRLSKKGGGKKSLNELCLILKEDLPRMPLAV